MDLGIREERALVTGAGAGIGRAIARSLAEEGCDVIVSDIDPAAAEAVARQIAETGGLATNRVLDVADRTAVFDAVSDLGPISILVNNAGIVHRKPTLDLRPEDVQGIADVNLFGALSCSQAVLPGMVDVGWGRIVNILSLATKMIGSVDTASYAITKSGLGGLTRLLAKEFGRHGVTVNGVLPGSIAETAFSDAMKCSRAIEELPGMQTAIGRRGLPEEVAPIVTFLCSRQATYITGEFVDVNGGQLMD